MTRDEWRAVAREAREGRRVYLARDVGGTFRLTHDGDGYLVEAPHIAPFRFRSVDHLVGFLDGQVVGRAAIPGAGVSKKPRRRRGARCTDPDPRPRAERKHARNAGFKARLRRRSGKGKK